MSASDLSDERELMRLGQDECLRLLATVSVGRVIFTIRALPAVRIMNFVLADDLVVLRTDDAATVARKAAGSIVTFEADSFDTASSSGWYVTVTGWAEMVADPELVTRYESLPLVPWAPGMRERFLVIRPEAVEGQRIISHPVPVAPVAPPGA